MPQTAAATAAEAKSNHGKTAMATSSTKDTTTICRRQAATNSDNDRRTSQSSHKTATAMTKTKRCQLLGTLSCASQTLRTELGDMHWLPQGATLLPQRLHRLPRTT